MQETLIFIGFLAFCALVLWAFIPRADSFFLPRPPRASSNAPMPDRKPPKAVMPKYKLIPEADGSYSLTRWEGVVLGYNHIKMASNEEEARQIIKNLERETIFIEEETKG